MKSMNDLPGTCRGANCSCPTEIGENYCSDDCKNANDVQGDCKCKHAECSR
jgi:hypothetical protein